MPPLRAIGTTSDGFTVYECRLCGCISADTRPVESMGCDCDEEGHDGDCTLPLDTSEELSHSTPE